MRKIKNKSSNSHCQLVNKLLTMIRIFPSVVSWSHDGNTIEFLDLHRLQTEVFPQIFSHSNLPSFTRLLNYHQFHKVPQAATNQNMQVYQHRHFKRGNEQNFHKINRRHLKETEKFLTLTENNTFLNENMKEYLESGINLVFAVEKYGSEVRKHLEQLVAKTQNARIRQIKDQNKNLRTLIQKLGIIMGKANLAAKMIEKKMKEKADFQKTQPQLLPCEKQFNIEPMISEDVKESKNMSLGEFFPQSKSSLSFNKKQQIEFEEEVSFENQENNTAG